ncbi:hypothetical protein AMTRI_Chr11g101170 [Amborella trichopoda]|uniref:FAD-binding domain-containing protein n=1 Tax=Amborella trichopoda TaxID=13333 RepID=U5DF19_AMBTC|nr:uncharacterized protein LOC18448437 [Amborella trichopoda]ERN20027.1 hypothetical protein AMTR_s00071p00172540 [Amborella trichopoda]|eukprot:XP_006858560.1 uncharacterized protein LOC18448437 [Amborella trichopoda]
MDEGLQEDIVIVGAGIAGLATALGLHRMGLKCFILESHDALRTTGFGLTTWTNAWKALEALGVADSLRHQHVQLQRVSVTTLATGATTHTPLTGQGKCGQFETRCLRRDLLVEALARELPKGCIKFGAKVANMEVKDYKSPPYLLHLADGTIIKAKVVIGCDGVNSVVSTWLGLQKPAYVGRSEIRGFANFQDGHGFEPDFLQYINDDFQVGLIPCNNQTIYWFFTWSPTHQEREIEDDPDKMKQLVLEKTRDILKNVQDVIERTRVECLNTSRLRCRWPWCLIHGNICKGNVCVAGDAFHCMTPDIGQGGCSALEDGVVLARCLGEAILDGEKGIEEKRISMALEKYVKERKWRAIMITTVAYFFGFLQQGHGKVKTFLWDKLLSRIMQRRRMAITDFNCGSLQNPASLRPHPNYSGSARL